MDLRHLRFADDNPALYGFAPQKHASNLVLHGRALSQQIRTSAKVLPAVFQGARRAIDKLGLDRPVTTFVYPSPDTNAHCSGGTGDEPILVFVSSALVKLVVSQELDFVIGHELGHFLFEHFTYPNDDEVVGRLRLLELRRASEFSADRAGLIACRDLDVALTAILKVASGLGEAHLDVDILEYIRQVRELQEATGDESLLYSTHPPFPLRARALLRFDSILAQAVDGHGVEESLQKIDEGIRRDIDNAASGTRGNQFTDTAMSAAFWRTVHHICSDGRLAESEQARLVDRFGREKVDALKRALATRSRTAALAFLEEKWRNAEATLEAAPLFVVRAARNAMRGFLK